MRKVSNQDEFLKYVSDTVLSAASYCSRATVVCMGSIAPKVLEGILIGQPRLVVSSSTNFSPLNSDVVFAVSFPSLDFSSFTTLVDNISNTGILCLMDYRLSDAGFRGRRKRAYLDMIRSAIPGSFGLVSYDELPEIVRKLAFRTEQLSIEEETVNFRGVGR
ncbi:MAG: hypothetical protein QXO76_00040 [Thermoproteota archaeon]